MLGVLKVAEHYLAERGVDAPRRSMELLMGRVLGVDRLQLYLQHDRPLAEAEKQQLRDLVSRRARHEPVAYLLGDWEFFGHSLRVTPAVLVPRPETEGLVERALRDAPPNARCVDLGTGSGAIAVALALARPDVEVWATDRSEAAVAVAKGNIAEHDLADRVHSLVGSYWDPLADLSPFDALVCNPPYVDPAQPDLLADDVRRYEPAEALFCEPGNPVSAYASILAGASDHLRRGAVLWFETGVGASAAALAALRQTAWLTNVVLENDLAGLPRYLGAVVR